MTETARTPRVWWSPTCGLWQQLEAVGDEPVYRTFSHDSGASFAVGGLPGDAVELFPGVVEVLAETTATQRAQDRHNDEENDHG